MQERLQELILEDVRRHMHDFSRDPKMTMHPYLTFIGNYTRGVFPAESMAEGVKQSVEEMLDMPVPDRPYEQAQALRGAAWLSYGLGMAQTGAAVYVLVKGEILSAALLAVLAAYFTRRSNTLFQQAAQMQEPPKVPQRSLEESLPAEEAAWVQALEAVKPELQKAMKVYEEIQQDKLKAP